MATTAGRRALVRVSGAAVVLTNEPTTANVARTIYTITNPAKATLDPTAVIVVEKSTDGGATWTAAANYTLSRLAGAVTFAVALGAGTLVRISGQYLPMASAAGANHYAFTLTRAALDSTTFDDVLANGGYMTKIPGQLDAAGSLSGFKLLDSYFTDILLGGNGPVVIDFLPDAASTPELRMWALLSKQDVAGAVAGTVTQSVSFDGTADADNVVAIAP